LLFKCLTIKLFWKEFISNYQTYILEHTPHRKKWLVLFWINKYFEMLIICFCNYINEFIIIWNVMPEEIWMPIFCRQWLPQLVFQYFPTLNSQIHKSKLGHMNMDCHQIHCRIKLQRNIWEELDIITILSNF